ncbi:hypothetical protein SLE2022_067150 [Rubroshorea leprosula]
MVVKMMRWPPWPPIMSRKFEAVVVVHRLEGVSLVQFDKEKELDGGKKRLVVEVKWKGQKSLGLGSFRRSVRRNFTEEGGVRGDGVVEWNEEFKSICNLSGYKEGVFFPWEVAFTVFNGLNQGPRSKLAVIATALLDLVEFASAAQEKVLEISLPMAVPGGSLEGDVSLCLSLRLTAQETVQAQQRSVVPVPLSPSYAEPVSKEKDDLSAVKEGLKKVRIFSDHVSAWQAKKACQEEESSDGRYSVKSEGAEFSDPFDTDSLDGYAEGESEGRKDASGTQNSFSYEMLACANWTGVSFYSNMIVSAEDESWIYYSHHKSDVGHSHVENLTVPVSEQSSVLSSKRKILPWRKRKLGFRSPKVKGEPLLKKDHAEEGGDDIDFDRRQLSSSDESGYGWYKSDGSSMTRSSDSEFGDDNFAVGIWEQKEVISRDGHMKLQAQVFSASIDQRSERAAGESACTALVAVIAHWLLSNQEEMPNRSEFDSLIREGSLEWRNLCENKSYIEQFPDKHFELETILHAKIRPLSVAPEKSFVGFFHPEGLEGENFNFLHGAMSFDNIWDEISSYGSELSGYADPLVYIVSWNDHFFVLKVEQDAYYILDTLGERLHEGCNQAYVLKFDKDTTIIRLPEEANASDEKSPVKESSAVESPAVIDLKEDGNGEIIRRGKECCKEYIKSFLAAIPIRELQDDVKRGLVASTPLHHRLQIEFHYTHFSQPVVERSERMEAAGATSLTVE